MMSPVALSFADDVLERDELIARLHTFSPLVAHWQELPHVFWVETAGEPVKGLSTAAFIRRLVTELRRAGYLPSAVWGCAPYAAALLAQRLPITHTLHLDRRQQNGALSGLPIAALNLEEATVKSLERLGVTHLRSLGKVSQDDLEARYGAPLKIRLRLLAGANPPWRIATPPPSCSRTLLIEHALTRREALLFVIAAPLEEALEELASQGLACRAMLISCACDDGERIRYAVRPARPSLDAQWLVELLRLKLENSALHSAIISADLELQSAPADAQQLHLFEIGRRDQRQSDEALDRIRAELGEDCFLSPRSAPSTTQKRAQTGSVMKAAGLLFNRSSRAHHGSVGSLKRRKRSRRRRPQVRGRCSASECSRSGGLSHCCSAGGRASAERKSTS